MIFFQSKAVEQRLQKIPPIEGPRGAIYDRNGIPLAISVSSNTVYAIPVEVEDVAATAQQLASILGLEEQYLRERLSKRSSVEWLQKKISDAQARKIIALDLPGVGVVPTSSRIYPYGSIAPQVLGFVGIDNQGLEGLELYYDRYLRGGKPGAAVFERDAHGRALEEGGVRGGYLPGDKGDDLVLTLDFSCSAWRKKRSAGPLQKRDRAWD